MRIRRNLTVAIGWLLITGASLEPVPALEPIPALGSRAHPMILLAASHKPRTPRRAVSSGPASHAPKPPGAGPALAETMHRNQAVRVGLTTNRERITLSSPGGFRVSDPTTGAPVWKDAFKETLTVGIRGSRPTEGRIYRVQVGSFDNKQAAEDLAASLRKDLGEVVVVAWVPDRRTWRIRVGEGSSRDSLSGVLERLRHSGYADVWIADEPVPQDHKGGLVLVDENYDSHDVPSKLLKVEALSAASPISVDGNAFRGSLEVRQDVSGGLRVVNELPIETYLRGVVPSELGPAVYPEIEALKAQTVAARTYTYRNLGQFSDEGFDLCDTPRCQVYGGIKAEHPLSDRAIQETEGVIAVFQGQPINSLYTSTCGGHTEDASEIFPEDAATYLTGVACAPEERSRSMRRIALTGNPVLVEARAAAAEAVALLVTHGILSKSALDPKALEGQPPREETERWIESAGSACGVPRGAGRPGAARSGALRRDDQNPPSKEGGNGEERRGDSEAPQTVARVARELVDRLGWDERLDLLIGREGAPSWFPDDPEGLSEREMEAVAYFLREKAWPEGPHGEPEPRRAATRGDLARLILFAARACDLIDVQEGIVRGGNEGSLMLSGKSGKVSRALAPGALLFADFGSGPVPVRRLGVVIGDKIEYHVDGSDRIDELRLLPGRQGLSDDRYSSVSTWQVAYTAEELAKKLDDYIGSGRLVDVVPVRRGVSGRVTEIKVVGTKGEGVIRGFSIRTALGLRENLFTVDRQRDRSGALRRIVFTGRGWGHGLGLCQVGAYGMALRGESYQNILAHYYTGITLETLP